MLREKVCLFVSLFCFLFYSSLCKDESRWPKEGALCPTDQVINGTCSCEEKDDEEILSCLSNSENPSGLLDVKVFKDEQIWNSNSEHPYLASVEIKCNHYDEVEEHSSNYDIVEHTANLRLDIGVAQDLTISNCFTESSYTNLLSLSGISGFSQGSYFKFLTNGIGKHISLHLKDISFADPRGLYANLSRLFLHGRGIQSITSFTFRPFQGLEELRIFETSLIQLPGNIVDNMPRLNKVRIFQNSKLLRFPDNLFGSSSNSDNNIEILDLTHNDQVNLLPPNILSALKNLKELNIGSNNFSVIPSDLLSKSNCDKLTKLVIKEDFYKCPSGCTRILPARLLESCDNLEEFIYSFHKVHETNLLMMPFNIFEVSKSTHIKTITIDNANLGKQQLFDIFFNGSNFKQSFDKLNTLSLQGNNISCKETYCTTEDNTYCDCDLITKIGELARHVIGNTNKSSSFKLTCNRLHPQTTNLHLSHKENVNAEDVISLYLPYCERVDLKTIIFYVAGIAIFFLSIVVVLCAKEHILIWLYNHPCFAKLFEIKFTETKCECDMHICHSDCRLECFCRDAFISYSKDDENFALLLRDNLEDSGNFGPESLSHKQMAGRSFSCLDHQRDWKAGNPIALNISESIHRSQCTLILLSQSFLSSDYCNQEFALAYQSKKLIVVMMDVDEFDSNGNITRMKETPNSLDLTDHPLITVYLKQYTYLKQSDIMKNWGKIAYHLPYRKMPRANNHYELYSQKTSSDNVGPVSV